MILVIDLSSNAHGTSTCNNDRNSNSSNSDDSNSDSMSDEKHERNEPTGSRDG